MAILVLFAVVAKLALLCFAGPLEKRQNDPECTDALCVLNDAMKPVCTDALCVLNNALTETYSCTQATNAALGPSVYCDCTSDLHTSATATYLGLLGIEFSTTVTYATRTAQLSHTTGFCPPVITTVVGSQITPTICARSTASSQVSSRASSQTSSRALSQTSSQASSCILAPTTITALGSTITAQACSCNGHPASTVTPLGLCGSLTASANCEYSIPVGGPLGSHTTTFYGCACNTRAWGSIPTSSLFISQPNYGGAGYCGGPICVPSANNNALATCQCSDWPVDNTLGPYTNNPCAGYTYTTTTTGTCSWQPVPGIAGGSTCLCADQKGSSIHLVTVPATCSGPVPVSAVLTVTSAS